MCPIKMMIFMFFFESFITVFSDTVVTLTVLNNEAFDFYRQRGVCHRGFYKALQYRTVHTVVYHQ